MSAKAVLRDISRRKKRETKRAELLQGIEHVAESIVITDLDGSILYVNPAFEKMTGYTWAEAIGRNPRILKSGHQPDSFYEDLWATLRRGETWSGDLVNKRKNGTFFNEAATISPIKSVDGSIVSYVAVKRDTTQEILLRDQLFQAEKWNSMGRLAGGIAHDFNNLLMVMRTYAEVLHHRLPLDDSLRANTEQMLKAVDRGASLTAQMLAFSRKQIISPTVINLNAVARDTTKMLERLIGEDVEIQVDFLESLWAIEADRDQMVQVLLNLCVNARDAMPRGGTLKIATGNVTVGGDCTDIPTYVSHGDYVMLSVTDSGIGMSQEIQSQVFEPFFTTKGPGSGTGLGLATVYGITKQNDGYVWLESEIGKGTRFRICLPRVERAISRIPPARVGTPLRGTETLLVVEDEQPLRLAICSFLGTLGYRVLSANSAEAALKLASGQERVDLLLTDVIMPRINGRELSHAMRGLRPDLKVIYVSGYMDDTVLRNGIHAQNTAFLQKPFGLNQLADKVRDTLNGIDPKAMSA
jgi:PAS domain S-box-containing protein